MAVVSVSLTSHVIRADPFNRVVQPLEFGEAEHPVRVRVVLPHAPRYKRLERVIGFALLLQAEIGEHCEEFVDVDVPAVVAVVRHEAVPRGFFARLSLRDEVHHIAVGVAVRVAAAACGWS